MIFISSDLFSFYLCLVFLFYPTSLSLIWLARQKIVYIWILPILLVCVPAEICKEKFSIELKIEAKFLQKIAQCSELKNRLILKCIYCDPLGTAVLRLFALLLPLCHVVFCSAFPDMTVALNCDCLHKWRSSGSFLLILKFHSLLF